MAVVNEGPNLRSLDGTVKLSRICPFCGRILLDQRLIINDLAVAAGGENAAKLLNLTVPLSDFKFRSRTEIAPSRLWRHTLDRLKTHIYSPRSPCQQSRGLRMGIGLPPPHRADPCRS